MRKEGLTALVAILVVASLGVGYLSGNITRATETMTSVSTTTATFTGTYDATYQQVADAYATHLTQLKERDVIALSSDYESNATIEWTGDASGLTGTYSGVSNIRLLWASTIGKSINFSVSDEHQSMAVDKGDAYMVNSTFDFQWWTYYCGIGAAVTSLGSMNGSVVAQDIYEHVSNNNNSSSWFIARETWNFTQFNVQCLPATTTSSSSTSTTRTTSTATTFTIPTCYETLDTVINPAPRGTVYMKVVTNQGADITNGTLFVTQSGTIDSGGREAGYCIKLSDVNGTGYLQLAGNATFIVTGYYNVTLMAGYNQGPWYLATIPLIQVPPNSNSTVYVTVSVPSGVVTVVTSSSSSNEGSSSNTTVTTTTTSATTIKLTGG
jgi:hypothetical protein